MKILIKENAKSLYISSQNYHKQYINWEWADILHKIQGQTLDVETKYLFKDQFNTVIGLRIMAQSVEKVIDDVRKDFFRCQYCGTISSYQSYCDLDHCKYFEKLA